MSCRFMVFAYIYYIYIIICILVSNHPPPKGIYIPGRLFNHLSLRVAFDEVG